MTVLIIGGACQGKTELARKIFPGMEIVPNLHLKVRDVLERGGDPSELLEGLTGKCVICDEIGCGIVPIDKADNVWRESTGRLCCRIASEADKVIRVTAGIPQYIKNM